MRSSHRCASLPCGFAIDVLIEGGPAHERVQGIFAPSLSRGSGSTENLGRDPRSLASSQPSASVFARDRASTAHA